jgi:hypothetical protein
MHNVCVVADIRIATDNNAIPYTGIENPENQFIDPQK